MNDNNNETSALGFDEEERLPWLEPIEDGDDNGVSMGRLIGLVLAGLAAIGLVVGGLWWWQNVGGRPRAELIPAPEGDYRVPPRAEAGRFDGDGDAAVAATEGVRPAGRIDTNAAPQAPVAPAANRPVVPATAPATAPRGATPPVAANRSVEGRPAATPTRAGATAAVPAAGSPATGGSGMVQLGSFASESAANAAWATLKRRLAWLAPYNSNVARAEVGGRTVYRLQAAAGSNSAARNLCARLSAAGEDCLVAR